MTKACKMLIFLFLALSLGACNAGPSDLDPSSSSGNDGIRGIAWIDWDASELLVMESFPMQVALVLRGDLGEIHITAYATHDPEEVCAALLEPFEQRIELGDFTEGGYSVWVNEGKVGDF